MPSRIQYFHPGITVLIDHDYGPFHFPNVSKTMSAVLKNVGTTIYIIILEGKAFQSLYLDHSPVRQLQPLEGGELLPISILL